MSRRSGLGRGLGALIPNELVSAESDSFREIPLAAIEPNRFQPREHFDEASLVSLSESIRELGVLQPVLVRPAENDTYELIAGERRWRAARKAGLSAIPAIIRTVSDTSSLEQALVENLHRADLHPLEEAGAYQLLMEDFGLTQEQVAARVGKSRPAVTNTLRLLQLPASTQRLVAEGRVTAGHARALLATPDRALQERLARQVVEDSWSVRQLEEAIRGIVRAEQEQIPPSEIGTPPSPDAVSGGLASAAPRAEARRSEGTGGSLDASPTSASPGDTPTGVGGPVGLVGGSGSIPPGSARTSASIGSPPHDTQPGPASSRPGSPISPAPSPTPTPTPGASGPSAGEIAAPSASRPLPAPGFLELEQLLADYFDTTVRVSGGRGRGKVTIEFADIQDLERIYRLIVDGT